MLVKINFSDSEFFLQKNYSSKPSLDVNAISCCKFYVTNLPLFHNSKYVCLLFLNKNPFPFFWLYAKFPQNILPSL